MAKIAILGAGSFGSSLAIMTSKYGNKVTLWSNSKLSVYKTFEKKTKLNSFNITNDINCVSNNEVIILAVPSFAINNIISRVKNIVSSDSILVSGAKGFGNDSGGLISDILEKNFNNKYVILSGPSHAEEIVDDMPTTIVASSKELKYSERIQEILTNKTLRVYVNDDIIGTQIGGALKNIIAIGCGISDGIGFGDNSKAALITRGLIEISRLGVKMGAKRETFAGLTCLGDLIVTCTSNHSRNRKAGIFIGKGSSIEEAITKVGMVVEGYIATKSAYYLSKKYNVNMPIIEGMFNILYNGADLSKSIVKLMNRPYRHETELFYM